MRVEVHSIDDFIAEVRDSIEAGATLLENCVRFRIDRHAQQAEAVSFDVQYHVTAVIENENNHRDRYLLDLTVYSGEDEGSSLRGTAAAESAKAALTLAMEGMGLKVRRGKIEVI